MNSFCQKHPEWCVKYYGYTPQRNDEQDNKRRVSARRKGVVEYTPPVRRKRTFETPAQRRKFDNEKDEPQEKAQRVPQRPPAEYKIGREPDGLIHAVKEMQNQYKQFQKKTANKVGLGTEIVPESLEQHKFSRLSDVAYKYGYRDKSSALDIIKNGDYIPDFKNFRIVEPLSNKNWVVLKNRTTGEVVMSFRGSDNKFADVKTVLENPERAMNVEDWVVNAHTAMGNPEKTMRYNQALSGVDRVVETLGIEPQDIIFTGHSLGGGLARRVAEIHNAEAHVFNAADHPLIDMTHAGSGEKGKVNAYRTYGDLVSAGHETQTPEHLKVTRLTAKPGTETNLIEQHGIEQFYYDAPVVKNGEVLSIRTSKLRNFLGTASGIAGKGVAGLGAAEVFAPIYEDKSIEAKEQGFLFADTVKNLAFEGALEPGGTLVDVIDTMGMGLTPEEITGIRKMLGKESQEDKAYSQGYLQAIKEVQKQVERRIARNPNDKDAVHDLNNIKEEYSKISADPSLPKEVREDYDIHKIKGLNSIDTEEGRNPRKRSDEKDNDFEREV